MKSWTICGPHLYKVYVGLCKNRDRESRFLFEAKGGFYCGEKKKLPLLIATRAKWDLPAASQGYPAPTSEDSAEKPMPRMERRFCDS